MPRWYGKERRENPAIIHAYTTVRTMGLWTISRKNSIRGRFYSRRAKSNETKNKTTTTVTASVTQCTREERKSDGLNSRGEIIYFPNTRLLLIHTLKKVGKKGCLVRNSDIRSWLAQCVKTDRGWECAGRTERLRAAMLVVRRWSGKREITIARGRKGRDSN